MWPFSIMQLFNLMARVMGTIHRIMTMEGMREGRFPWFELQTDLLKPLLCLLVECVERVEVTMEN
jgi:hypothetical protein